MHISIKYALIVLLTLWIPAIIALLCGKNFKTTFTNSKLTKMLLLIPNIFFTTFAIAMMCGLHKTVAGWAPRTSLWVNLAFIVCYLPTIVYGLCLLIDTIISKTTKKSQPTLTKCVAFPLIAIILLIIAQGFINRNNFKVERVEIAFDNLPEAFDGITMAVITDVHAGNVVGNYFSKLRDTVNALNADFIFLTGDLVNAYALEIRGPHIAFNDMVAKHGKYAVMGNHDYGDYFPFNDSTDYVSNLLLMRDMYAACGFDLLDNDAVRIEHDSLNIINIIGIENWGTGRFSKHGNLDAALHKTLPASFNILISHDPTSWSELVLNKHPEIDLTISGHTHAAQCSLHKPHISPSSWIYKQWDGLYQEGKQFLYVSRGLGYVGIPIHIGQKPELTLITLHKK